MTNEESLKAGHIHIPPSTDNLHMIGGSGRFGKVTHCDTCNRLETDRVVVFRGVCRWCGGRRTEVSTPAKWVAPTYEIKKYFFGIISVRGRLLTKGKWWFAENH